ncbi:hypothetical protein AB1Y20_003524 [Prymnesium parvum]|uniref:PPM-type phosphatase domain-containing protein n=1 Tax=Prymnesium parvum TaxID=97485 RepID=A0AB34J4Y8_PRYPA
MTNRSVTRLHQSKFAEGAMAVSTRREYFPVLRSEMLVNAAAEREQVAQLTFYSLHPDPGWLPLALSRVLQHCVEDGCTAGSEGAPAAVSAFLAAVDPPEPRLFDQFVALHNQLLDWYQKPPRGEMLARLALRSVSRRLLEAEARTASESSADSPVLPRSSRAAQYEEVRKSTRVRKLSDDSEAGEASRRVRTVASTDAKDADSQLGALVAIQSASAGSLGGRLGGCEESSELSRAGSAAEEETAPVTPSRMTLRQRRLTVLLQSNPSPGQGTQVFFSGEGRPRVIEDDVSGGRAAALSCESLAAVSADCTAGGAPSPSVASAGGVYALIDSEQQQQQQEEEEEEDEGRAADMARRESLRSFGRRTSNRSDDQSPEQSFTKKPPQGPEGRERWVKRSAEFYEESDHHINLLGKQNIGTYSCHGTEEGEDGITSKINQDCACMLHPLSGAGTALFCVFDGHGTHGDAVSQEVMHSMYYELERDQALHSEPVQALERAFEATQEHLHLLLLQDEVVVDSSDSGACAVLAYFKGNELWVAGAGDCRAVLGREARGEGGAGVEAVRLSTDHNVEIEEEKARIEAAGGWVMPMRVVDGEEVPARSYKKPGKPWLGPGLRISRALGDTWAELDGLIYPFPDVRHHVVQEDDLFLILASDGVWEFLSDEAAVRIVKQAYDKGSDSVQACKILIAQAALLWRQNEGMYRDDITAYVINLKPVVATLTSELASLVLSPRTSQAE